MSRPLACEVSEDFPDEVLAKLLVLDLIVGVAEVLLTNLQAKIVVYNIKLLIFIFLLNCLFLALLNIFGSCCSISFLVFLCYCRGLVVILCVIGSTSFPSISSLL